MHELVVTDSSGWNYQNQQSTGDLLVKSRLYNAVLHDSIKKSGLTQKDFAASVGIGVMAVGELLTLRKSPWHKTGEPRKNAQILALHLDMTFDELFPRSLYALREMVPPEFLLKRYESAELVPLIEARNVETIESSYEQFALGELREALRKSMRGLKPREELVLKLLFGLDEAQCTSEEIGKKLFVSSARIYQIASRAMEKLKYPSNSKYLQPFLEAKQELSN